MQRSSSRSSCPATRPKLEETAQAIGRREWLGAVLVAVVTAWTFQAVLGFEFVGMDDPINLLFNPHLDGLSGDSLKWMFGDWAYVRRYMPLGWLLFAVIHAAAGLAPGAYHLAGYVLHIVSAVLLYRILLRVLPERGRGEFWGALFASLWWAANPMRAEVVGWASGLLYGGATFGILLSFWSYLRAEQAPRRPWVWFSAVMYAISVLIYPVAIGAVVLFPLWDRYGASWRRTVDVARLPSTWRMRLPEKLIFLVPALFVAAVTLVARYHGSAQWDRPAGWNDFGILDRAGQAGYAALYYLWKPWWPVQLTPVPTQLFDAGFKQPIIWSSLLGVLTLSGIMAVWARGRWGIWLLALGYLGLLAPVSGLMDHPYFPFDRYASLPALVVACGLAYGLSRMKIPSLGGWVSASVATGMIAVSAVATQRQLEVWRNGESLTDCTLSRAREPEVIVDNLAKWAIDQQHWGNSRRADEILTEAERRYPGHPRLAAARTEVLADRRDTAAAGGAPLAARLHLRMALEKFRAGRARDADEHFQAALQIAPHNFTVRYNVAINQALAGRPTDALSHYYRLVAAGDFPAAARTKLLNLIADVYASQGRHPLARAARDAALSSR